MICYDTACQQSFDMIPNFQEVIMEVSQISGSYNPIVLSVSLFTFICVCKCQI